MSGFTDASAAHARFVRRRQIAGFDPDSRAQRTSSHSPTWTSDGRFVILTWHIDPDVDAEGRYYDARGELYAIRVADRLAIRLTRNRTLDVQADFR